jgi:hypothetical protein
MTALCDRPNLSADELRHMLSLAMPSLELMCPCLAMINGCYTYRTSFKKYNDELFVFFTYHPSATQNNRWSVEHEGRIGAPWRNVHLFQKRVSKRFATLLDAITYYETEIKK